MREMKYLRRKHQKKTKNDVVMKDSSEFQYFFSLVAPVPQKKMRPCLRCEKQFKTCEGKRICVNCTNSRLVYGALNEIYQ
jgi:hypothetical protein